MNKKITSKTSAGRVAARKANTAKYASKNMKTSGNNLPKKTKKKDAGKKPSKEDIISGIIEDQKQITMPDKKTLSEIESFVKTLNSFLKKNKVDAEASLGGSVAKGTFIKDNFDADIFVKFSMASKGKNISDILEGVLKKMNLKASRVHGSRDYFQIKKEFTYELVPVIKVKDYREAENVADMSPLHVDYFQKQSKKIKNLRDEIRISKVFMKSARVYGAESYIKGFSGHVVDLLVIKYKTFRALVSAAAKWKDELIIDIENHHIDAKMSLNTSKISGPLIIVDPIQKNRNAAAALSKESYDRFRERCKEFLSNPSPEFFVMPNFSEIIDEKIAGTKDAEIYMLNIEPLEGKRDVSGSKILKIREFIEHECKKNDFSMLWSDWEFNEKNSRMCFAFERKELSQVKIIQGPPLEMKESCEAFKIAHPKTFIKDSHIFAEEKRKFTKPIQILRELIELEYVREKCKKIELVSMENK